MALFGKNGCFLGDAPALVCDSSKAAPNQAVAGKAGEAIPSCLMISDNLGAHAWVGGAEGGPDRRPALPSVY